MDIYIPDDRAISRDEHATIVYEDHNSEFFLVNCKGNSTLLNGKPAEEVNRLESGDRITMGKSDFVFIPFCTEDRKWEEE